MSFTSAAKFCVYDSWDLTRPSVSPRSRLYHLKPIGMGTAHTESCTSYVARLAKEHCVSAHLLISRELVPASNKPNSLRAKSTFVRSGNYRRIMKSLNGRGRTAQDWVEIIERLTLQRGLRLLTMLTWRNVLTDQSLLRPVRAWCPRCLEEQCESEEPIYEQLLWTLGTVNVCIHHQRRLETICPHCHNQALPFAYRSLPGHCSQCRGWLGHSVGEKEPNFTFSEADDFKYQLWVANQMGELIAAAPNQQSDPLRERVTEFIPNCINQITGGNVSAFARVAGLDRCVVNGWLRKQHLPTTDLFLKMCYSIGISFSNLLTKSKHSQTAATTTPKALGCNNDLASFTLLAALDENPPPTLQEVADRLGYKNARSLRKRCPELSKLLTTKRRASLPAVRRRSRKKAHDDAGLKLALQQALEEGLPPPLDDIAENLGYSESRPLRRKFSSLCEAIVSRRAGYFVDHRTDLRIKLEAILLEDPPPALTQVTQRLGYKVSISLSRYYPKLCRAISRRYARYRKTQFENIRHQLQAVLFEKPPPSLRVAASRSGYRPCYLRQRFPKVCQAIVNRYAAFRKKSALERKARAKARIWQLAFDLHAEGTYPSAGQINKASKNPTGLNPSELCAVLRNVRRELGLLKSG